MLCSDSVIGGGEPAVVGPARKELSRALLALPETSKRAGDSECAGGKGGSSALLAMTTAHLCEAVLLRCHRVLNWGRCMMSATGKGTAYTTQDIKVFERMWSSRVVSAVARRLPDARTLLTVLRRCSSALAVRPVHSQHFIQPRLLRLLLLCCRPPSQIFLNECTSTISTISTVPLQRRRHYQAPPWLSLCPNGPTSNFWSFYWR